MSVQENPVATSTDKPQSSDEEDEFQLLVIAARLGRVKLITDLLDCAVGPRRLSLGKNVESPLHAAARRDHLQVAKLIVEVGGLQLAAARDAEGQTPVDVAGTQTRDFLKEVCRQNTEYRATSVQRSVERESMPARTPTPLQHSCVANQAVSRCCTQTGP